MSNNIGANKPATVNQITQTKPKVPKTYATLQGFIGGSMNGGMLKPIAWERVMGGTFIKRKTIEADFKLLTPKTVSFQGLFLTLRTYFVPDSAVWRNYEKFISQKGGSTVTKINEEPNLGGKVIPRLQYTYTEGGQTKYKNINWTDTDMFRDSFVSAFLPRYLSGYVGTTATIGTPIALPKVSVLPIRAMIKIWNEFERNKEYDQAFPEYDGDTVTSAEWYEIIGDFSGAGDYISRNTLRGKRMNSYYTDYRTELLGKSVNAPTTTGAQGMVDHIMWEEAIASYRAQAQNAMKEDRIVAAEIRGTRPVKDGKARLLKTNTVQLNYNTVTQSSNNVNTTISDPEYKVMGTQGGYCYTRVKVPVTEYEEIVEDGTLITVAQVSADSVFECSFDRTVLNVGAMDKYRPELVHMQHDVIYEIEKGATNNEITSVTDLTKVQGFKRKFSEYFKLPNVIGGDMTTNDIYETDDNNYRIKEVLNGNVIKTNRTYQFFEESDRIANVFDPSNILPATWEKRIWKDYTDLLIDKNQAVQNGIKLVADGNVLSEAPIMVRGQNQIYFVGIQSSEEDLPIDPAVKENFSDWGEE